MQDLKRTIYQLEPEEFEKLFCQRCSDYDSCSRKPTRMVHCKVLIEIGRPISACSSPSRLELKKETKKRSGDLEPPTPK